MDRVSEEERGRSQSSKMSRTGKRGVFNEGKRKEERKCNGFDEWMVVMYECMHLSVSRLASNKTSGVQEKVRSPK